MLSASQDGVISAPKDDQRKRNQKENISKLLLVSSFLGLLPCQHKYTSEGACVCFPVSTYKH